MFFSSWLRNKRRTLQTRHPAHPRPARCRPLLEQLEDRCLLSAGFLDPTFGFDGVVTTKVGQVGKEEYAHDVAIYPAGTANAGKIVVVGGATAPSGSSRDHHFAVVRYNPDGSLDPSFGSGGKVSTSFVSHGDDAMAVALVGEKVLVGGYTNGTWTTQNPGDFALARFNANGTLDQTFGTKGKVVTDFGHWDVGRAMAVQADGKIVLAGMTNAGFSYAVFAVARYNPNGTLDTSFGNGGRATIDVGERLDTISDPRSMDVTLVGNRIVLVGAGYSTLNMYVVQLSATGQLDPTFGAGGIAQLGRGRDTRLAVQSDGKLVVSYNNNFDLTLGYGLYVTRLLPDGATDTTFGTAGTASLPWSVTGNYANWSEVAVDLLGRIVIGGSQLTESHSVNNDLLIARFTPSGALDSTFGVGGFNTSQGVVDVDTGVNALVGLTLQADGKAILVGTAEMKFVTARFDGDPPLLASSLPEHAIPASVTSDQVQPLLAEALGRWQASGVNLSALGAVDIRIGDLGGTTLGLAVGHTIWLDDNAAGWGWFVDPTPGDDSEFTAPGNQGEQHRMDLLSVLEHEIGHLLGHEHEATGVMRESLAVGTRYTPGHDSIDCFFAISGVEVNDMGWGVFTPGARRKAR